MKRDPNNGQGEEMTRELETEIKYTQNWGSKLDRPVHTTFRWPTKLYKVGATYPVTLIPGIYHRKKACGLYKLLSIDFKRIRDVTEKEIQADIGSAAGSEPKHNFLEILRAWYSKKSAWDGQYSIVQKLTLEKLSTTTMGSSQ